MCHAAVFSDRLRWIDAKPLTQEIEFMQQWKGRHAAEDEPQDEETKDNAVAADGRHGYDVKRRFSSSKFLRACVS